GWAIARATGQPTDLDPELGHLAFEWGKQNLKPEYRGEDQSKGIGLEVPVPDDAPIYDRLAGFFGRQPR
ncbi:MAG: TIGR03086 family metal-binding protein, partial [Chloroflexota bacterium]